MKKVITFLLAFVIFLSSVAFSEPSFAGAWATVRDLDESVTEIVVLRVFPNNTAFYSRQQFTEEAVVEEESLICSWETTDDGSFSLISETGEIIGTYSLINDKRLLSADNILARFDFYARETAVQEPEPTEATEPAGITVPSGVYVAGEDFPAGTYRVELADPDNGGVFLLYDSISDVNTAFAYLYEYRISKYDSPVVGKIEIKEGNALTVRNTVVILLPYEGL